MLQPHTKLPWELFPEEEQNIHHHIDHRSIGNATTGVADFPIIPSEGFPENAHLQDAEYVLQAANNFPRAIELLQHFVDKVDSGRAKSFETYNLYKDFLNKVNDTSNIHAGADQQ